MKGKIVLLPFPFTNLTITKKRPALVILERINDVVVVFISSKIPEILDESHILIKKNDSDFHITGLKVSSVIYLDKIATISKELVIGELGQINKRMKRIFNNKMSKLYHF